MKKVVCIVSAIIFLSVAKAQETGKYFIKTVDRTAKYSTWATT